MNLGFDVVVPARKAAARKTAGPEDYSSGGSYGYDPDGDDRPPGSRGPTKEMQEAASKPGCAVCGAVLDGNTDDGWTDQDGNKGGYGGHLHMPQYKPGGGYYSSRHTAIDVGAETYIRGTASDRFGGVKTENLADLIPQVQSKIDSFSKNASRHTATGTCPHCGAGGIESGAGRCPGCNYQLQWDIMNFDGDPVNAYDDGKVGSRKTAIDNWDAIMKSPEMNAVWPQIRNIASDLISARYRDNGYEDGISSSDINHTIFGYAQRYWDGSRLDVAGLANELKDELDGYGYGGYTGSRRIVGADVTPYDDGYMDGHSDAVMGKVENPTTSYWASLSEIGTDKVDYAIGYHEGYSEGNNERANASGKFASKTASDRVFDPNGTWCEGTGQEPLRTGGMNVAGGCPACYEQNPNISDSGYIQAHNPVPYYEKYAAKTAAKETGYFVVSRNGSHLSGPYSTMSEAAPFMIEQRGATVQFQGPGDSDVWTATKGKSFPVGYNTVNGSKHEAGDFDSPKCMFCGGKIAFTGSGPKDNAFGGYEHRCLKCGASQMRDKKIKSSKTAGIDDNIMYSRGYEEGYHGRPHDTPGDPGDPFYYDEGYVSGQKDRKAGKAQAVSCGPAYTRLSSKQVTARELRCTKCKLEMAGHQTEDWYGLCPKGGEHTPEWGPDQEDSKKESSMSYSWDTEEDPWAGPRTAAINKTAISDTCRECGNEIHDEGDGVWVDNSGGDVCGVNGGNEPHEPSNIPSVGELFSPERQGWNGVYSRKTAGFDPRTHDDLDQAIQTALDNLEIQKNVTKPEFLHGFQILHVKNVPGGGHWDEGYRVFSDTPQEVGGIMAPGELPPGDVVATVSATGHVTRLATRGSMQERYATGRRLASLRHFADNHECYRCGKSIPTDSGLCDYCVDKDAQERKWGSRHFAEDDDQDSGPFAPDVVDTDAGLENVDAGDPVPAAVQVPNSIAGQDLERIPANLLEAALWAQAESDYWADETAGMDPYDDVERDRLNKVDDATHTRYHNPSDENEYGGPYNSEFGAQSARTASSACSVCLGRGCPECDFTGLADPTEADSRVWSAPQSWDDHDEWDDINRHDQLDDPWNTLPSAGEY